MTRLGNTGPPRRRVDTGSEEEIRRLVPRVREELQRLVATGLDDAAAREAAGSGELIRDVCRRLVDRSAPAGLGREEAYLAAARAVRSVLVEHARSRHGSQRVDADASIPQSGLAPGEGGRSPLELVPLDEALDEFARENPRGARVVELRYFAGLSHAEVADAMGTTERRVQRWWVWAQAWLYCRLGRRSDLR
ncbi:MAG: hypothetical protein KDA27_12785 [Candidatus Eisenbacteria bacterium]|uniref:RNA polymerase sigma-70 ECF-like HTH domain-containing protein n=1 Tax=Eiseniibacteriota bacterium TaxID=2212470 RepID=A0A956NDD2_UNCEI|nr:hypothetical protein [Candidatus Eisenbacteria bacterium]